MCGGMELGSSAPTQFWWGVGLPELRSRRAALVNLSGGWGGWISREKLGAMVELLATPMVYSGKRNGERKRGADYGDDAWRRGRRGGLEARLWRKGGDNQDPAAVGTGGTTASCMRQGKGREADRWGRVVQCRSARVKLYLNCFKTV
jgi:hypothetical protein